MKAAQLVLAFSLVRAVPCPTAAREVWCVISTLPECRQLITATIQVLGFAVIGSMLLATMQALGEMAVLYPVNGAFYTYIVRFIDPSLYVET